MRLLEFSDATTFFDRSKALLMSAEAENNLLLSSAITLARSSAARTSRLSFYIVENENKVVCAALNASDRRLLLSLSTSEAAAFMGRALAERGLLVRGVLGPAISASAFCDAFGATRFAPKLVQRIMRLDQPREHSPVSGIMRTAKDKDLRLLMNWSLQFVVECGLDEKPDETKEVVRRYLENRQLFIWEDTRPVAMAGWGGLTPNGVRVNMVYTDLPARNRGYAGMLVHVLSRKLLAEGHRLCFLFSDANNAAANRVYERLGYRVVGDFIEFRQAEVL